MTSGAFDVKGFLAARAEQERVAIRGRHSAAFENVETVAAGAFAEINAVGEVRDPAYLVGLGFWLRSIECCQAVVLLVERGLPGAPFPLLRTAFECLFTACALWSRPELADKLQLAHDTERIKQAKAMIDAGAATRVTADKLADLKMIAAESSPGDPGLTTWEAAGAAGMVFEYQTAYRGLGIAGAHASLRSIDDYVSVHDDGSIDLRFGPDDRRADWLLGLVATCLAAGIQRHNALRSQSGSATTPP